MLMRAAWDAWCRPVTDIDGVFQTRDVDMTETKPGRRIANLIHFICHRLIRDTYDGYTVYSWCESAAVLKYFKMRSLSLSLLSLTADAIPLRNIDRIHRWDVFKSYQNIISRHISSYCINKFYYVRSTPPLCSIRHLHNEIQEKYKRNNLKRKCHPIYFFVIKCSYLMFMKWAQINEIFQISKD